MISNNNKLRPTGNRIRTQTKKIEAEIMSNWREKQKVSAERGNNLIKYVQGNILNTPAVTIVNTVNTVGVMGKGIALSLKNRYSGMYEEYLEACKNRKFRIGQLMYYKQIDHEILLFPTKVHWRYPSNIKWIEAGLKTFCEEYKSFGIDSIAFPRLGCGNGGLNWLEVRPLMEQYLSCLPLHIFIYTGSRHADVYEKKIKNYDKWLRSIALDFNENALLKRFGSYMMVPYRFFYQGQEIQMTYLPGQLQIIAETQSLCLSDDKFIDLWKEWIDKGFIEDTSEEYSLLYIMLQDMGYLEEIGIENESEVISGYQLLLMRDRANKKIGEI